MKTLFIFDAKVVADNETAPARLTVQYPLHLFSKLFKYTCCESNAFI